MNESPADVKMGLHAHHYAVLITFENMCDDIRIG